MSLSKEEKLIKLKLFNQGLKNCSRCNEIKNLKEFDNNSNSIDGLRYECKECRIIERIKNKEKISLINKRYRDNNKEILAYKKKQYRIKNQEKLRIKSKNYRDNNKDIAEAWARGRSNYSTYFCKLVVTDNPTLGEDNKLMVSCKNCTKLFYPTNREVDGRVQSLKGNYAGEHNFYCSEACKEECPLYNFATGIHRDPNSKLFIGKLDKEKVRACQTDHLKQLQFDEVGYSYCEKCGKRADVVELHHTLEVAKHGLDAISSAGHMLVCNECHKEFNKQCRK